MKHKTYCKRETNILKLKYFAAMFALTIGLLMISTQTARAGSLFDSLSEFFGAFTATENNDANSATCTANPVVQFSDIDGKLLREAIRDACPGGTITFHQRVEDALLLENGQITIDKNLTIQGPGADKLTIRSTAAYGPDNRIFQINAGVTATISGLTIADGNVAGFGGGIQNFGNLTLTDVIVKNNAAGLGGGVYNQSVMTLVNSTISNNTAGGRGGGIYSAYSASTRSLNVSNSTISNNTAGGAGGGLYLDRTTTTLTNTTVSSNKVTPDASDFSKAGGGIYNETGTVTISSSTIADNSTRTSNGSASGAGGGISNGVLGNNVGTVNLHNTIIAGNDGFGGDFHGRLNSQGYNLIERQPDSSQNGTITGDTTGNIIGTQSSPVNARIAPLFFYGGRTRTHALLSGSPAINAGDPTVSSPDQRGASRVGRADIGAFEVNNSANGGNFVAVLPDGFIDDPYEYMLLIPYRRYTDPPPPNTYEVSGGAMPSGIALTVTPPRLAERSIDPPIYDEIDGFLSIKGTNNTGGNFNFSITTTENGNSNVTDYSLRILAQPPPPGGCQVNPVVINKLTDSAGSLRRAVRDACPGSTITFVNNLIGVIPSNKQITIDKNLTIRGPGADKLTIQKLLSLEGELRTGQPLSSHRIIAVNAGVTATILGLTISGADSFGSQTDYRGVENSGNLTITDSGFTNHRAGGGIKNFGTLTVTGSIFLNNSTEFSGGGIDNLGTLSVTDSIFSYNKASGSGGGISSIGNLTINSSTFEYNSASGGGGIMSRSGTLSVTNSTFSINYATEGGGLHLGSNSVAALTNSTVSYNSILSLRNSNGGGGIYFNGNTLTIVSSTITNNSIFASNDPGVLFGGGIIRYGGTINMRNSILAENNGLGSNKDFFGTINSQGYNLIGINGGTITGDTTGNIVGTNSSPVDPQIAPLGFYGGRTRTQALFSNSPAVNAGDPAITSPDQRGAGRVGRADIGAFEVNNSANGGNFVAVLPDGINGTPYDYKIVSYDVPRKPATNGGLNSYDTATYELTGGALPEGISLSSTRPVYTSNVLTSAGYLTVGGTTSASGTFRFSITATDGGGSNVTDYSVRFGTQLPTLTAPAVSPICNGTVSSVNVSWSDAGRGSHGYYVDISTTPDFSQFINKQIPAGTTITTFGSEANLQGGRTYYSRVYYIATNEHSPAANFTAGSCSQPTPTPTPTVTPTPTPTATPTPTPTATPTPNPTPTPLPALTAPTVSPLCSGTVSSVNVSWSDAGRGSHGYYVDISTTPNFNTYFNKLVAAGTTNTTFGAEANLQGGTTYYSRVYYIATNEHSPAANFTARTCAFSIAGTVNYGIADPGQTGALIPNVQMTATGAASASVMSNSSGIYQFNNFMPGGSYTVTPSKSGDVRGINSLDATRIQQHLVGMTTLSANQLIAADTDGNGSVNSLDAVRIQQSLIGMQTSNIIGRWKFLPPNRLYNNLSSNFGEENYQAVLIGEVSGNWASAASVMDESEEELQPVTDEQNAERFTNEHFTEDASGENNSAESSATKLPDELLGSNSVLVTLPSGAMGGNGSTVTIPVSIGGLPTGSQIESFDFSVFYDPAILQPVSPAGTNTGTLSASCSVLSNSPVSGRVIVSGACAQAITTENNVIYNLTFNVIGSPGQMTGLSFRNPANNSNTFQFNNGSPIADPVNGQFLVLPVLASNASVSGRVLTPDGRGLMNAVVVLTDINGAARSVRTNPFGYYRFDDVGVAQTYIFNVKSKSYTFAPQTVTVMDDITALNFRAL